MLHFDQIQAAALAQADRLLTEWFPNGRQVGREFKVGNLAGERGESLSVNLDTGLWSDFAAGIGGHDLIDLYAKLRHDGDRVLAARALSDMLGMGDDSKCRADDNRHNAKVSFSDDWLPMVPPPGTPRADNVLAEFDVVHEYTNAADRVTHYVGRIEARNGRRKQFMPITFGTLGGVTDWHKRAPAVPRPLYGLNRLATKPDAAVILCEGEKAADAAQVMFFDHACIAWFGGTGSVDHADLTPLAGRDVVIWPDNDKPGQEAAAKLAKRMPRARVLRVDDLPEGADAADVAPDNPDAWLADRLAPDPETQLRDLLSVHAWAVRPIAPPTRLLGELATKTTRMFLVGRTGLGKTMLGFAMACGMASGSGFLHWQSARPARVLYIDGEMPGELIRTRAIDGLRRSLVTVPPGNLIIFARDMEDELAARFPMLGRMPPLNTEAGHNFVHTLISIIGEVDVVIFDNVMSLITGDQKDEVPWSDTQALISSLTTKQIGQVWLDHTGHNADRQYGSSTKAWRFDTVGVMTPLPSGQVERGEVAFGLSFDHPGKARRRTSDNWRDFETCTIRLRDDIWRSEFPEPKVRHPRQKVSPTARKFHEALLDALIVSPTPGRTIRDAWFNECARRGLADVVSANAGHQERSAKKASFRKYLRELTIAEWIGVDGETVCDLTMGRAE